MYYKITFSDKEIDNLQLNGNNFISPTALDPAIFGDGDLGKLDIVPVSEPGNDNLTNEAPSECIPDALLLSHRVVDGRSWLVFGEKSPEQKAREAEEERRRQIDDALIELYEMIGG